MTARTPDKPRYVVGALGPTSRTASISPDVNDPGARNVTYDELVAAYLEQANGLVDGGADLLLIETIFDTLNAKAAIFALETLFEERGRRWPVMISGTITDASGRTLSGQVTEAFWHSVRHVQAAARRAQLRARRQGDAALHRRAVPRRRHVRLLLPERRPAQRVRRVRRGARRDRRRARGVRRQRLRQPRRRLLRHDPRAHRRDRRRGRAARPADAGRDAARAAAVRPGAADRHRGSLFVNVGERTNITGSARFRNLIKAGDYPAALAVARQQVEAGAQVIDINMDEGMIDGVEAMDRFTKLVASEPDISRVPTMIDSSKWEVIEAGLKCVQGKAIVNSISLKEGEEKFVREARLCRKYGAAVVVMAFDEDGQADNLERRTQICRRAYDILTEQVGFPAEDIIFDPNIFAVATGIEEHANYGLDFIEATRWIKQNLPGALVSGGVSNVSFSFRGNNPVREAIHAVFLYHAIAAGMDMGIVNAGALEVYDEVPELLRERIEDVILNRRPDSTERLLEIAGDFAGDGAVKEVASEEWRSLPVGERITHALVKGIDEFVEDDTEELRARDQRPRRPADRGHRGPADGRHERRRRPVRRREDVPAAGGEVRPRDEEGRRLPDPVHRGREAARRRRAQQRQGRHGHGQGRRPRHRQEHRRRRPAVQQLRRRRPRRHGAGAEDPRRRQGGGRRHHRALRADHAVARRDGQPRLGDGAAGLRHPAADRRRDDLARAHRGQGRAEVPRPGHLGEGRLAVGAGRGRAAVRRAAAEAARRASEADYEALRERHAARQDTPRRMLPHRRGARAAATPIDWTDYHPPRPRMLLQQAMDVCTGPSCDHAHHVRPSSSRPSHDYPLEELRRYIDWQPFFNAWEMRGRFPDILHNPATGEAARRLYEDAQAMLDQIIEEKWLRASGVFGLFPANQVDGDDIEVYTDESRSTVLTTLHQLRQQTEGRDGSARKSLADFVAPKETGLRDYVGAFAVTAGLGSAERVAEFKKANDDYSAILLESLADRLAEAFAERLHERVRKEFWALRARRAPRQRGADRGEVRAASARRRATRRARSTPRSRPSGSCSTSRPTPASSSPRAWPCGPAPR